MSTAEKKEVKELILNMNIPTIFVDNLEITTRSDGSHLIRLSTFLPEGFKEEVRIMVPNDSLKKMIDVLCSQSNYYPSLEKPSKSKTQSK